MVPSFSLPSSVGKQSQLLLQPTEVEFGLQVGVEFDNSHSVQLNVELDLQVREEFDNIPYSLYFSPSIELNFLVNQFEPPCLSVLVDNDCCTSWYCILIPYPTLAHHSSYLSSMGVSGGLKHGGLIKIIPPIFSLSSFLSSSTNFFEAIVATLGSILDSQLCWKSYKFHLARWSHRVAWLCTWDPPTHPPGA